MKHGKIPSMNLKNIVNYHTVLIFFYSLLFFIWFMFSIQYWKDEERGNVFYLFLVFLAFEIIALIAIFSVSNKVSRNGFVIVAFAWLFMMPPVIIWAENNYKYFFFVIFWPLAFLSSYILLRKKPVFWDIMKTLFVFIFVFSVSFFLRDRLNDPFLFLNPMQNNWIYFALLTLPWLLVLKNKVLKTIVFIILFLAVLISFKRAAIIIMTATLIPFIRGNYSVFRKYKVLNVFVLLSILSVFAYTFIQIDKNFGGIVLNRLESMEKDQGSGRLGIYEEVIKMQKESSLDKWILGHGHFGVSKNLSLKISAHNDFLEVLYDYGIFVFILYIVLWLTVIKRLRFLYKQEHPFFVGYLSSFIIFLVMSMVSHLVLYASYFIFMVVFWGAVEGILDSEKAQKNISSI